MSFPHILTDVHPKLRFQLDTFCHLGSVRGLMIELADYD